MQRPIAAGMGLTMLLAGCLQKQVEKIRSQESEQGQAEPSHVSEENGEVGITLDSATILRIQLQTDSLRAYSRADETELPAMVVTDPGASSAVRAGVAGRVARLEGVAWPRFGTRVEAGDSVAVIADARPVLIPRSGTVSQVAVQPGELVQPGQELFQITSYDAPLVQLAWGASRGEPPATADFSADEGRTRVHGTLTGPAPEADPVTRDPAWLYRVVSGWRGIRPGASVTAYVADGRGVRRGVLVPSNAVVQWDALAWAYQEREAGRFVRVRVSTDRPVPGGWLVTTPFHPGDRVVTVGAGQLLSEEFRARIVVGEEVGE